MLTYVGHIDLTEHLPVFIDEKGGGATVQSVTSQGAQMGLGHEASAACLPTEQDRPRGNQGLGCCVKPPDGDGGTNQPLPSN